jgi:hypothetical protein
MSLREPSYPLWLPIWQTLRVRLRVARKLDYAEIVEPIHAFDACQNEF